jgi:CHAD domain-containing protein
VKATEEREIKLGAPPRFTLPEMPGQPLPSRTFVSTYFDTVDHRLATAVVTLRRRVEKGKGLWQLKLPSGTARLELELPGGPAGPPNEIRDLLVAYARGADLVPVARLRTRRAGTLVHDLEGPLAEVVIDAVQVLDGRRVIRRLREIEVELVRDEPEALGRIEKVLRDAGATDGDRRPKVFQALGLEGPPPLPAPSADEPPLQQLQAMMAIQLAEILAHDPGTRLGRDPEQLHQMRVATRRLRALLRAGRPLLDLEWAEGLREEIRWLGDALGAVRDLDVLQEHLETEMATLAPPDARAGRALLRSLDGDRTQARQAMIDALRSERYLRLLETLEAAVQKPRVVDAGVGLGEIAADEFRRLRRAVEALGPDPSDQELHEVRIKGKRARYAAELAEPETGKPAARFIKQAKVLQDLLGEHQDAVVAEQRIRALASHTRSVRGALAAGRLLEREAARRHGARESFAKAWQKLEKRGRKAWA